MVRVEMGMAGDVYQVGGEALQKQRLDGKETRDGSGWQVAADETRGPRVK
jgi:hypothetical protein